MQDDWNREVFLVAKVPSQERLDRSRLVVEQTDFIIGLRFVQRGQLHHAIGLTREGVQHHVKIGMVLFQQFQARVEARIGGGEFGKVAVVLPAVVRLEVAHQSAAVEG